MFKWRPNSVGIARTMRATILFAIAALILAAVFPRLYTDMKPAPAVATSQSSALSASSTSSGSRTVTIRQGGNGHFQLEAVVDGRRMEFLVDTGATGVALRESDASWLGIHPAERDYTARSATANGVVRVAPVMLDRVEVGDIVLHNVAAVVFPDQTLGQNLLGMSFLSRVRWQQENGRLVLEQ
jgi:aspartyl protease family protein